MIVAVGPPFGATDAEYEALAEVTGLVGFELRNKIKLDAWGVVRVLADEDEARRLSEELRDEGFSVALLKQTLVDERERLIIPIERLELGEGEFAFTAAEQAMRLPYTTIGCMVVGEVRSGQTPGTRGASGAGFGAVNPSAEEIAAFRASQHGTSFHAIPVMDIHFLTVLWAARVDARLFDFSCLDNPGSRALENLDALAKLLSRRSGARVDRAERTSSLMSFAARPTALRHSNPPVASVRPPPSEAPRSSVAPVRPKELVGTPFDSYSRLVAEAERQARAAR